MRTNSDKPSVKRRLYSYRTINPDTGCWLWTGARLDNGYGSTGMVVNGKKANRLVHRVSMWCHNNFDIISPLFVLHRCDVKHCFNPDHLFIGTQLDNMRDMWKKGRGPNQHHPRKLTKPTVIKIRAVYAAGGWTTRSLAVKFNVNKSTIGSIVNRETWAHV